MKVKRNECIGCPPELGCIGPACKHQNVIRFYCDKCKCEDTLYYFDDRELCIDCIKKLGMEYDIEELEEVEE